MNYLEAADRYLKINAWLQRRYRGKADGHHTGYPGRLILYVGGNPSRYTVLDLAFFLRYVADHPDNQRSA